MALDRHGWGKDWASSRNAGQDDEDHPAALATAAILILAAGTYALGTLWGWW